MNMVNIPKKILIVAGEASADRYGARLVAKLRSIHDPEALSFFGTGGDAMASDGESGMLERAEAVHGKQGAVGKSSVDHPIVRHSKLVG